jgi:recombination protein RecA
MDSSTLRGVPPLGLGLSRPIIPTGSLKLDLALGCGGIPGGCFVEIVGPESSGKTTLSQHIISEAQKQGGVCVWIDADHTWDPAYASRCGVNLDRLIVSTPDQTEQAIVTLNTLAQSGAVAVIVLDSLAALSPADRTDSDSLSSSVDDTETLLSNSLRSLSASIRRSGTTIIFTDLVIGRRSAVYHDLATHTARLALKLFASIRLNLQPVRLIQAGEKIIGSRVRVKPLKNEFCPCLQTVELDIMYENGLLKF